MEALPPLTEGGNGAKWRKTVGLLGFDRTEYLKKIFFKREKLLCSQLRDHQGHQLGSKGKMASTKAFWMSGDWKNAMKAENRAIICAILLKASYGIIQNIHSKHGRGVGVSPIAWFQFAGQTAVMSSEWPPPKKTRSGALILP